MTTPQKIIKGLAIALAILLTVGIIGGFAKILGVITLVNDDGVLREAKSYSVSANIIGITLDIAASELTIKDGECFALESNLENLKAEEDNNRLVVSEERKVIFRGKGFINLTIPADYKFNDVRISAGAGTLNIETLEANDVEIELGAGRADVKNMTAHNHADIDGGAGKLTLENCNFHNLDLDIGVGGMTFSGTVTGNSSIDCGVGTVSMDINGKKEDYTIKIEKGIGEIEVDGESVSDDEEIGSGTNNLGISGGVGSAEINFIEPNLI